MFQSSERRAAHRPFATGSTEVSAARVPTTSNPATRETPGDARRLQR
jgi:hypothetical protein